MAVLHEVVPELGRLPVARQVPAAVAVELVVEARPAAALHRQRPGELVGGGVRSVVIARDVARRPLRAATSDARTRGTAQHQLLCARGAGASRPAPPAQHLGEPAVVGGSRARRRPVALQLEALDLDKHGLQRAERHAIIRIVPTGVQPARSQRLSLGARVAGAYSDTVRTTWHACRCARARPGACPALQCQFALSVQSTPW